MSFSGGMEPGIHVLECELQDSPTRTAMGVMVPLARLPELLNKELRIPFDGLPSAPGYALEIAGTVVFTQVDTAARSFTGRLLNATVRSIGDDTGADVCTVTDQPFWAGPGSFL